MHCFNRSNYPNENYALLEGTSACQRRAAGGPQNIRMMLRFASKNELFVHRMDGARARTHSNCPRRQLNDDAAGVCAADASTCCDNLPECSTLSASFAQLTSSARILIALPFHAHKRTWQTAAFQNRGNCVCRCLVKSRRRNCGEGRCMQQPNLESSVHRTYAEAH